MIIPLLAAGLGTAHAFCGTYVGQPGQTITNATSQVLVAREGTRTTLTLVNDFASDPGDFAMVIPVPEVLGEEDVSPVIPELIDEAERYSSPRLVEYSCEDFYEGYSRSGGLGCSKEYALSVDDAAEMGDTGGGVNIEAEFDAGEYRVVILSAEQSGALLTWLNDNGYGVSETSRELLQEYIDAGSYFMAAQVTAELLPPDATSLSPLRIGYDADVFSLPIRLGTANSEGVQELIVYAISDNGQVRIVNYPEATLADECMDDIDTLGTYYQDRLDEVLPTDGEAHWLMEYGWSPAGCDPCPPGGELPEWVVAESGFQGDYYSAYFTRLRIRYTPAQATEDLLLNVSGLWDTNQVRYIRHDARFEDRFPLCVDATTTAMAEDPGDCESELRELRREDRRGNGGGCAAGYGGQTSALAGLLGALGLAMARRRR